MSFADDGYLITSPVAKDACNRLLGELLNNRAWDASLFLTEAEFDANPVFKGVNPEKGRNLLGTFGPIPLDIQNVLDELEPIIGSDAKGLDAKIVCGLPDDQIPEWVKHRAETMRVANLGAFIKPQYRDCTYFRGIDWHQDIIDYPGRNADFITLYVYLHDVGERQAPLHVLEGSHRAGATRFPHDLEPVDNPFVAGHLYEGEALPERVLTGRQGFAAAWHACTLHKTEPADALRLSVRVLIGASADAHELRRINANIKGPLSLERTRVDLDEETRAPLVAA